MSSARLSPSSSFSLHPRRGIQPNAPPIHVAFSSHNEDAFDILAMLFASRSIALWKIYTPLPVKKGRRDAVVPTLLWRGDAEGVEWMRQVCVREGKDKKEWVVGILGEGEGDGDGRKDVIFFIVLIPTMSTPPFPPPPTEPTVESIGSTSSMSIARTWEMQMPGREGRIVEDEGGSLDGGQRGIVWEARDGGLWEGAILSYYGVLVE